ncbi:hypothetical protein [Escherichia phage vB_EcoM_JL1]|nr:hypothetical protein [Escherichia phage vB_EcoM_JL1]
MARVLNYSKVKGVHNNAVYIGRDMKGIAGNKKFHNPFKMFKESQRDYVCEEYRKYLWKQIKSGEVTIDDLLALDGKDLVCWCAPARCHGDTIMAAIEWAKKQR